MAFHSLHLRKHEKKGEYVCVFVCFVFFGVGVGGAKVV